MPRHASAGRCRGSGEAARTAGRWRSCSCRAHSCRRPGRRNRAVRPRALWQSGAVGSRPLRFAIVREAGRLDCAGQGGDNYAHGNCSFATDPRFAQLLRSRGIAQPTRDEAFALVALNVRSDLINTLAAARYPTPTIDQLIAMTAVGVNGAYISGLAQAGYRPTSIDSLVQFRAMNITPEYVGSFTRIGYAHIDPEELVQLKALNVTADYVAGFQRLGYSRIAPDELVQLKA